MNVAGTSDADAVLVEVRNRVGVIRLNRPRALNALNEALSVSVMKALTEFDSDDAIGAMVVTGSEKAFAAGADIAEMKSMSFMDMYGSDYFGQWDGISRIRKPIIAAVHGYALGGGCELAMMCDMIFAAKGAKFGQPEIKLGILPGIGGTQRLPRLVGRGLAMDMILTGRMIDAEEAKAVGLIARIVEPENLEATAIETANTIAGYNLPAVQMAKEAINRADEASLSDGLRFERRLFQAAFSTDGQKEGMSAFIEKRAAVFNGR